MLDEIKIKTRGEGEKDFVWFSSESNIDKWWSDKYNQAFYKADSNINLFADIENGNYRIFFEKIMRPWQITRSSTPTYPYVVLSASGKCGSESAKAFYKILTNYFFGNKQEVESLFAEVIPKDFIEEVFYQAQKTEVETLISEKVDVIVSKLSDVEVPETKKLEDNKYIFDNFEKNKNAFFSELKRITVLSNKKEYISLVLMGKGIGTFLDSEFDCKPFTSGLCLTTGSIDGGKPIVKTIRESKPTTQPIESVKVDKIAEKDNSFFTEGTTSIQKAPKGNNTENPETEENDSPLSTILSRIKSDQSFRKLLIITSVIILALLFMVRSCVKKSGNGSEKNSPEQKEQPSSPQSPDSFKKSTTDTLEIKADSSKKTTKIR